MDIVYSEKGKTLLIKQTRAYISKRARLFHKKSVQLQSSETKWPCRHISRRTSRRKQTQASPLPTNRAALRRFRRTHPFPYKARGGAGAGRIWKKAIRFHIVFSWLGRMTIKMIPLPRGRSNFPYNVGYLEVKRRKQRLATVTNAAVTNASTAKQQSNEGIHVQCDEK